MCIVHELQLIFYFVFRNAAPVAKRDQSDYNYNNVIKMGYNLTSSNKKIFLVLREMSTIGLCLEDYPNKSKWIKNALPKKYNLS